MEISTREKYLDRNGVEWRVFEKYAFGKALLVQVEKPWNSVEMRFVDIRANFTLVEKENGRS